ncbi:thermonuclease family protein [uncultured Phenylobacterium sp.]|uniref:thermonuclease family protein n=1 Tax=uncultured Phenylobacterium sp. TaxID=349273 RepID=UPI0025DF0106|nr:thermonuclease family protein [uncultured Phenylobacterium sp.]
MALPAPPEGRAGGSGLVTEVADGNSLTLADGLTLVLAAVQAPLLPAARPPWPHASRSRAALSALVLGQVVAWRQAQAPDRHGRVAAQVVLADGRWLQAVLVADGQARVRCRSRSDHGLAELLALEDEARAAGRGLWALDAYRVRTPDDVGDRLDRFHIVEGTIVRATRNGAQLFLDFGSDWRRDFSILVGAPVRRDLERRGLDPMALAGVRVRVRGWAAWSFGPRIALACAAQLEILDGVSSPPP